MQDKKKIVPNRKKNGLDYQQSGSYDGSVKVGDIQPVGYSETGPNIGPTGTSDAPSYFTAQNELLQMALNERRQRSPVPLPSNARRAWNTLKKRSLKLGETKYRNKVSNKNSDANVREFETKMKLREDIILDNEAKVERKLAFDTAKAWNKAGFIAIGTDLNLKFNSFDKEEE